MFRAPFLVKIAESPHGWLHRSRTSSCKMTSSATNSIWSFAWPRGQFVYAWRCLSIPKMSCEFSLICARYQRRVISSERKKYGLLANPQLPSQFLSVGHILAKWSVVSFLRVDESGPRANTLWVNSTHFLRFIHQ